ncbi:MAG: CHASE domain-containing protein [Nitrospinae bacterium]|nr:CHASE domain-containing protein [Nitrospinota bacterium]
MDKDLKIATSFHWFHWLIVFMSILLTVFAWWFSSEQVEDKVQSQFKKEADQVVELVSERMLKYEDALWGGVAAIQANGGDISYGDWLTFSTHLKIDVKYPGINGIGVIYHLRPKEIDSFLKKQRQTRPNFKIHPLHNEKEYFPITYIEPFAKNSKAVGLDMAHEKNRYTAALKARDTGLAQITGPIELVQDAEKTPGFLFYAPFYLGAENQTLEDRKEYFVGMVYAPFVVKKLMQGTLLREKRRVDIQINDGQEVLYNEHIETNTNFDSDPLFRKTVELNLYGRTWSFDIRSTKLFRSSAEQNQPFIILAGGIIIDSLIILLFVTLTESNRRAVEYANAKTEELKLKATHLEKSNKDLEQFSYLISHDLKAPLRGISNILGFIEEDHGKNLDADLNANLEMIDELVVRSQTLLNDVLTYSSFTNKNVEDKKELVGLNDIINDILESNSIEKECVSVKFDPNEMQTSKLFLRTILNNLIVNARKHGHTDTANLKIHVQCEIFNDKQYLFLVKDNGPGIPKGKEEHIFKIFKQLAARDKTEGTGLGLALVKSIVINSNCSVWVESPEEGGAEFKFTWPK